MYFSLPFPRLSINTWNFSHGIFNNHHSTKLVNKCYILIPINYSISFNNIKVKLAYKLSYNYHKWYRWYFVSRWNKTKFPFTVVKWTFLLWLKQILLVIQRIFLFSTNPDFLHSYSSEWRRGEYSIMFRHLWIKAWQMESSYIRIDGNKNALFIQIYKVNSSIFTYFLWYTWIFRLSSDYFYWYMKKWL